MKKVLSLLAVIGLMSAASAAFGGTIVGSRHDLSATGTYNTATYTAAKSTQICIYCHAPHAAAESLPLWNRSNPDAAGFTLYSGVNMANVSFKSGFTADSTSLFCMSCHDGQTNLNAIHNTGVIEANGSSVRQDRTPFLSGLMTNANANLGGQNLSKTHPINFPVKSADTQSDLNTGGTNPWMGPSVASLGGTATFPLFRTSDANTLRSTTNRSLECGSCHAVHNTEFSPFLRDTMKGSLLCLGCHNK